MTKWRVLENRTRAVWAEYVQNNRPNRDDSWPPEGQYTLLNHEMDDSERREWSKSRRHEVIKNLNTSITEAILFNALGDPEFMNELKQQMSDLLLRYPKDPAR